MKYFDFSPIRRKNVFTKNFCLILLLVFTLLSLFSIYIYHISSSAFSRQQSLTDEAVLNQYIEAVDDTLHFIDQLAATTASNSDIINTVILPGLDNQQRNFSVISNLKALSNDNAYIDNVFLYEHSKGCLFSSDSTMTALNSYSRSGMIRAALTNNSQDTFMQEANRSHSRLVQDGQQLYFVYDFIYSNDGPLGTLIIVLNKDNLFSANNMLASSALKNYNIAVSNDNGRIFFCTTDANTMSGLLPRLTTISRLTLCNYSLYAKETSLFSVIDFGREFLPIFIGLLLISLLITFLITRKTYAPIKSLTELVGSAATSTAFSPAENDANEFDYLTTAYQQLITDQNIAADLISRTRPELEQKLFSNLLNGTEYSSEELERHLTAMKSEFCIEEKYQIILVQLESPDSLDDLSLHICNQTVQQMCRQEFHPEWGNLQILSRENRTCILIIQYPADASIAQIKRYIRSYQQALEKQADLSNIKIVFAAGKIYYHIADIRLSWQDAKEQLHSILYYEEDTADQQTAHSISESYIASQISQLNASLSKGAMAVAQSRLDQLMKNIFTDRWTLPEIQKLCSQLLDIFVERELTWQAENDDGENPAYTPLYRQIQQHTSIRDLKTFMETILHSFIETLTAESQKKQNRLIARAKEYIAANYSNCSLSINEIAQDVGCSPSYLSNIFTEYNHENLVAYLNHYRIHMAKELLSGSQILIRDVGYKTGFNTIQNFNRVFKKETGMTPNEYRKKAQKL